MKYLSVFLMLISSTFAFANIPVRSIDHIASLTEDALYITDKRREEKFQVKPDCVLPITEESIVRFTSESRSIKTGGRLTFIIDKDKKFVCKVMSITSL